VKRFRVVRFDFNTRVRTLTDEIQEHWEERVKEQHRRNREQTVQELVWQFVSGQQQWGTPVSGLAMPHRSNSFARTV
jgi:hypothetical protein